MDRPFLALVIAAAAVDAIVLVTALVAPSPFGPRRTATRVGPLRFVLAACLALAALVAKIAVTSHLGLINGFGFIALLYVEAVVVVPLAAAILLAGHRRGAVGRRPIVVTSPILVIAAYLLLLTPLGVYGTFIEPRLLQLERVDVPLAAERAGAATVRLGVLADLQTVHISDYERRAVDRLMAQRPDIVLVAGDLIQGSDATFDREVPALRDLLSTLRAPGGAFAIAGNVDWGDRLERAVAGTPVRALRNETARVTVQDRRITIVGVDGYWLPEASAAYVNTAAASPGVDDVRIVLSHLPDAVLDLPPRSRIDLTVAGHTHGGQVRMPLYGPAITLSLVPRAVAAGGLHEVDGNRIYVSRGVGAEHGQAPLVRINCPPEITLLELTESP